MDREQAALSLILQDRFLSKWSSAFAIDADHFFGVKRDAAELEAGLTVLNSQDRIFRPGIGMKIIVGPMVAVCKTDAARIEEEIIAKPSYLLSVGVTTAQDTTGIGTQELLKFLLRRGRQDHV